MPAITFSNQIICEIEAAIVQPPTPAFRMAMAALVVAASAE